MKVIFPSCPVLPLNPTALFVIEKKTEQLSNFSEATIETDMFSRIPWQILEEVFGDSTKPKFYNNDKLQGIWI